MGIQLHSTTTTQQHGGNESRSLLRRNELLSPLSRTNNHTQGSKVRHPTTMRCRRRGPALVGTLPSANQSLPPIVTGDILLLQCRQTPFRYQRTADPSALVLDMVTNHYVLIPSEVVSEKCICFNFFFFFFLTFLTYLVRIAEFTSISST